ncbi:hypothetical protein ARMSODRAFT_1084813 [Armillaria solidipes]|uniref:Uncharacterized protein n=1 Tax=Armillaria solidipes TaxID=1076256 RepID=A0A2H3BTZ5_9AGAR|nr:hypothetical protein ARMSODRAFT_1084813 [Armillaria solidipes]
MTRMVYLARWCRVKQSSLASRRHALFFSLVLHSGPRPFDSCVMLEDYPTVLTEKLEIKTGILGLREPTLKRRTMASRCGSCVFVRLLT